MSQLLANFLDFSSGFVALSIRFDGDINLSTGFKADLVTTFIVQSILDPNLSIRYVSALGVFSCGHRVNVKFVKYLSSPANYLFHFH